MRKPGQQDLLDDQTEANPHVIPAADQTPRPGDPLRSIAQEEARLARLEAEVIDSRLRLGALQTKLASLSAEPEIHVRLPAAVEARHVVAPLRDARRNPLEGQLR